MYITDAHIAPDYVALARVAGDWLIMYAYFTLMIGQIIRRTI